MSNLCIYRSVCTINTFKLQNIFSLSHFMLYVNKYIRNTHVCQRMTKDGNLPSVYIEACREIFRAEILCWGE